MVEESLEAAVSELSELQAKVTSMKEDMKAIDSTRREIVKDMEEMEERAMLEESVDEELTFTENDVQPMWVVEQEVKRGKTQ